MPFCSLITLHLKLSFRLSISSGPFHTSDKIVYLDIFSVITNILQVRMVCRDSSNSGRSRQNLRRTADKVFPT